MQDQLNKLSTELQRVFASSLQSVEIKYDELTILVHPDELLRVLSKLNSASEFKFDQLIDLAGVDYLEFGTDEWNTETPSSSGFSRGVEKASFGRFTFDDAKQGTEMDGPRYAVVYHLLSVANNLRIRVKVYCEDNELPILSSVTGLWSCADWYEREAFDLFGIVFESHPDLRRILTDYGFTGHPFRKDFPLVGHVEVRYDPDQKRVIYQPVSIEPRINVPKVIRDDHRFEEGQSADQSEGQSEGKSEKEAADG
ncbi:MAG: NADH-quinone oxidoreductase subunit C [Gammaproteobacteria bacterium]|nr:MAG: NADH-quinone oxidoreductase subunit C [Gammaproteobacteria bacterium]